MVSEKIKSYAKLNLALNISGKNSKLHKIETIVKFVHLHDEIFIKKIRSSDHKISFIGKFAKGISKDNTISKLLKILEKRNLIKNDKFKIVINKRIPNKSGLGGGSMNAANILKYLVKKKIIKIDKKQILTISKLIGSDVILGFNSSNSILKTNSQIKYFKNCPKIYTLIVKPNIGCSTKKIYSKVRKFDKPKFNNPQKKMFNLKYLKGLNNSLEPIALSQHSQLKKIKIFLENLLRPVFVRMTGSGSAFVAYYRSKKTCEIAKRRFNKKFKYYWCIATKTI